MPLRSSREPRGPLAVLAAAEALRTRFGRGPAARKLPLLAELDRIELPRPGEVRRLHELLCFWRAYPDDRRLLAKVERMLHGFERRSDLKRHAARLAGSGIAGTEIRFRFFARTAAWLAARWPDHLHLDGKAFDGAALEPWLPLLAHPAEVPALDEFDLPAREWIARLKAPAETDGAFLVRALGRLPMSEPARETLVDGIDLPLILTAGPKTPSRTRAKAAGATVRWRRGPLSRERLSSAAIRRLEPVAVREVAPREGARLLDLAREAMVTRARDLDAFANGDSRDVRWVDFGAGLSFVAIGSLPERRLLLESVYGYLTLVNGVPVGYVLTASLFGSAEIAYNVFETFRGAEAAPIYARALAMTRWLFGCDSFTIVPYQLGEGNDEALGSGAWWFYRKMGFAPRDRRVRAVARTEEARMRREPTHRSSPRTLSRLASANLHLFLGSPRRDVLGEIEIARVGLHATRLILERFGSDREAARRACAGEAQDLLDVRVAGWSPAEQDAFERWAPLVVRVVTRQWSAKEKSALVEVVRAKGGRRESEFVRRFDRHPRLRAAVQRLAAREP